MWKEKLEIIKLRREKRNRHLNEGCSLKELEFFQQEVKNKFKYDLPKGYIDFLSVINGLEYNGLVLYGIDENIVDKINNQRVTGYIDTNEIWYENDEQKEYMFFGDSNMSWYCYNIRENIYVELDKPSGELEQEFSDFTDMLENALESSLV